jgi:hypothetical protein
MPMEMQKWLALEPEVANYNLLKDKIMTYLDRTRKPGKGQARGLSYLPVAAGADDMDVDALWKGKGKGGKDGKGKDGKGKDGKGKDSPDKVADKDKDKDAKCKGKKGKDKLCTSCQKVGHLEPDCWDAHPEKMPDKVKAAREKTKAEVKAVHAVSVTKSRFG